MDIKSVRVAAVQAAPAILDLEGCVEKIETLTRAAVADGAQLVVLPETFIPMYPMSRLTHSNWDPRQTDLFEQIWANAVEAPGPVVDRLAALCRELDVHLAVGVNEREPARSGTLYNALLLIGPTGLLHKHRKLMPTHHERLFHGIGNGEDLAVVETPLGRIGGLICWENLMPLARYTVYQQRPQIWLAPTMDDREVWTAAARTIAWESGAWVVSVCGFTRRSDFPKDLSIVPSDGPDVFTRGGTVIVAPDGEIVAGPLFDEEGTVIADCDLGRTVRAKYGFDAVGHYSREDVLLGALANGNTVAESSAALSLED